MNIPLLFMATIAVYATAITIPHTTLSPAIKRDIPTTTSSTSASISTTSTVKVENFLGKVYTEFTTVSSDITTLVASLAVLKYFKLLDTNYLLSLMLTYFYYTTAYFMILLKYDLPEIFIISDLLSSNLFILFLSVLFCPLHFVWTAYIWLVKVRKNRTTSDKDILKSFQDKVYKEKLNNMKLKLKSSNVFLKPFVEITNSATITDDEIEAQKFTGGMLIPSKNKVYPESSKSNVNSVTKRVIMRSYKREELESVQYDENPSNNHNDNQSDEKSSNIHTDNVVKKNSLDSFGEGEELISTKALQSIHFFVADFQSILSFLKNSYFAIFVKYIGSLETSYYIEEEAIFPVINSQSNRNFKNFITAYIVLIRTLIRYCLPETDCKNSTFTITSNTDFKKKNPIFLRTEEFIFDLYYTLEKDIKKYFILINLPFIKFNNSNSLFGTLNITIELPYETTIAVAQDANEMINSLIGYMTNSNFHLFSRKLRYITIPPFVKGSVGPGYSTIQLIQQNLNTLFNPYLLSINIAVPGSTVLPPQVSETALKDKIEKNGQTEKEAEEKEKLDNLYEKLSILQNDGNTDNVRPTKSFKSITSTPKSTTAGDFSKFATTDQTIKEISILLIQLQMEFMNRLSFYTASDWSTINEDFGGYGWLAIMAEFPSIQTFYFSNHPIMSHKKNAKLFMLNMAKLNITEIGTFIGSKILIKGNRVWLASGTEYTSTELYKFLTLSRSLENVPTKFKDIINDTYYKVRKDCEKDLGQLFQ